MCAVLRAPRRTPARCAQLDGGPCMCQQTSRTDRQVRPRRERRTEKRASRVERPSASSIRREPRDLLPPRVFSRSPRVGNKVLEGVPDERFERSSRGTPRSAESLEATALRFSFEGCAEGSEPEGRAARSVAHRDGRAVGRDRCSLYPSESRTPSRARARCSSTATELVERPSSAPMSAWLISSILDIVITARWLSLSCSNAACRRSTPSR